MGPRVAKLALAILAAAPLVGCGSGDAPISDKDSMTSVEGLTSRPTTPKGEAPPKSTDKVSTK